MIDPVILFFLLGLGAGLLRSELRLPAAIYEFVSTLLLLSIGLKGGVELWRQPFADLLPQMAAVIGVGFLLPLIAFSRGLRDAGWEPSSNIRLEIVCSQETAARIGEHLRQHYYQHYAMIALMSEVHVLRPEKF
jgi:hypothetical protein